MTLDLTGRVARGDLTLDIDLHLSAGLTSITGANGSGKTTLLRVIAGFERLDAGELTIDGEVIDTSGAGPISAAHERPVTMMFQDHRLFDHLSAVDNVAFAARRRRTPRAEARQTAMSHLEAVGMASLADARPRALSLGQRQRVALARTLAAPTRVALLDEPFAAIDESGRAAVRALLPAVDATYVLWVTHDPADATVATQHVSVDRGVVRQTLTR